MALRRSGGKGSAWARMDARVVDAEIANGPGPAFAAEGHGADGQCRNLEAGAAEKTIFHNDIPIRECADAAKLGPFGEKERAGAGKTAARLCRC